jgi:uncharacterized protein YtpQ (UPF0354 family)
MAALAEATGHETVLSPGTLDRVFPVVRHSDFGSAVPGEALIREPLAGDLSVFYVLDSPSSVEYINSSTLSEAKLTMPALREAAKINLARLSHDLRIEGGAVNLVFLDGYYESSMLLDKQLWHRVAREVPNLVAIAPSRDIIAFGDGSNPQVAEFLSAKAEEISQSTGGMMTAKVLHWTEVGWVAN